MNAREIVFIDTEVDCISKKVLDIGAINEDGLQFHENSNRKFADFLRGSKYICGHNILKHDLKYLAQEIEGYGAECFIDTLYLSPLLFPKKPYHSLVKDDKLTTDELNNPLNDSIKAKNLFYDEVAEFEKLGDSFKRIYFSLLHNLDEFKGFFHHLGYENATHSIAALIRDVFIGMICENAPVETLIKKYPAELAYALSQINIIQDNSITPPWVLRNYPEYQNVLCSLRSKKCSSCTYCDGSLDETRALKRFFHYDEFRSYDGEPLQQNAVKAAVNGESILAIFPTGGGKSIAFQLPALMAGASEKGLTVVISPLQSLMKDQTDNLETKHNITEAVTINGSLDPLERAKAFERVEDGSVSILYISPESLRSKSIERLLLKRNVTRFVIDEAHCFSSWGQDFRVDYLYIGEFIRSLQEKRSISSSISVSCFTATAKQRVIADIKDYFMAKLSLELKVFRAGVTRANLSYHVSNEKNSDEKYLKLRQLIADNDCPTIVYVSRTKKAEQLALKLTDDGYHAMAYHGQMDKQIRIANQDAFMNGEVKIIVATTAFGMGVDKKDVRMVIHYDISDSLENYVQESGRAGRDEKINADCYVLFNDEDLNKHFSMLNQSKISRKEIQQVWKALKELTRQRTSTSQSALEIARKSGWDDSVQDIETRVKTVINALEQAGFVKRGQNMIRIFADSILVKNMAEARAIIDKSARFDDSSRQQAARIISSLISARSKTRGKEEDGEARIDYISDRLGIIKEDVIRVIGLLREEKILDDAKDLTAYIKKGERTNYSKAILTKHLNIEDFLFRFLDDGEKTYNIKEMNGELQKRFPSATINQLSTILNYFSIKRLVKRTHKESRNHVTLKPYFSVEEMRLKRDTRGWIAGVIIGHLYSKATTGVDVSVAEGEKVEFSVLELKEKLSQNLFGKTATTDEVEDALYYLLKIGAMKIEGGFLVIYNTMHIERLKDNKAYYANADYALLAEYYQNKREQIHIVGEYAHRMARDHREAMTFVEDYFQENHDVFISRHFAERTEEISRNITRKKFNQLFGELSPKQLSIIEDQDSKCIVVLAGPGSGKTKLLTHKLASLYMMEDVKHEQMLMLTFSRAAATEFKKRLITLIGNAANYIQITTFHSYCFDLLGKVGSLEKSDRIIRQAIGEINAGKVDVTRLTKTVLVIDEAQDMSKAEYLLVKTLMEKNDDLRVVAVGDDDQNIYEFRGSNSEYFAQLLREQDAQKYELVDNYRSNAKIVDFANHFAGMISKRLKVTPIVPMKKEDGIISVCKLSSNDVVIPIVNKVLDVKPSGSTCIVARTNEEVLNIVGLLNKKGITAKQIRSNDDFDLYNLVELRDFINDINDRSDSYAITEKAWQRAKEDINKRYKTSDNLRGVLKLIGDFEEINNTTKYKSDFTQFVRESKLDDFAPDSDGAILVSTIHQTKGREFDNVFLALSGFSILNDAKNREIYVAITRAKQNLYVLYNGNHFDKTVAHNIQRTNDATTYSLPAEITLQLSHKNVNLGYFACCQQEISTLVSGRKLDIRDGGCFNGDTQVLMFSKAFSAQLCDWKTKGYTPTAATIRHVVFWQGKNENAEIRIILPNLELTRPC